MLWLVAGQDYYNLDMLIQIHDPGNPDNSGVTARIIGVANPIAVPPQYVNDLRMSAGYNPNLATTRPIIAPVAPPVVMTPNGG